MKGIRRSEVSSILILGAIPGGKVHIKEEEEEEKEAELCSFEYL
jgi:hypothetical protein